MRWLGVLGVLCLSLAFAAGAAYCLQRAQGLQHDAAWALTRADALAGEYVRHLSGESVDEELRTLAQRRALLERAHTWQSGQQLGVMAAVLTLLAAYGLFLRVRLRQQLVGGDEEARQGPARPDAALGALAPPATRC